MLEKKNMSKNEARGIPKHQNHFCPETFPIFPVPNAIFCWGKNPGKISAPEAVTASASKE